MFSFILYYDATILKTTQNSATNNQDPHHMSTATRPTCALSEILAVPSLVAAPYIALDWVVDDHVLLLYYCCSRRRWCGLFVHGGVDQPNKLKRPHYGTKWLFIGYEYLAGK